MDVAQFAKYVIDNMSRATLANALNIANKLDVEGGYKVEEFIKALNEYLTHTDVIQRLGTIKTAKIVVAIDDCQKHYFSQTKYQKHMIIDNLIIDIWCAINDR